VIIWLRGSLAANPYHRTAFRVARVPREIVRHRTVVQLIGQTRQLIQSNPGAHSIGGEPVRASDVNTAEQVLLDPAQRVIEELLEHATEKPPIERLRRLLREVVAAMAVPDGDASPAQAIPALAELKASCVTAFLQNVPRPDPSFGGLELATPPAFGTGEAK